MSLISAGSISLDSTFKLDRYRYQTSCWWPSKIYKKMNSMAIVYCFVSHPAASMLITDTTLQCIVVGRYDGLVVQISRHNKE
jgi:hypothetical protein